MSEREAQLLEFWKVSAKLWTNRMGAVYGALGGEPTKIDLAKKRGDAARLVREKVARLAAPKRKHVSRQIRGTMRLVEKADQLCAPTIKCEWCGEPFGAITRGKRPPAIYCTKKCAHASWRARRTFANG
jgi:hypothetical protein